MHLHPWKQILLVTGLVVALAGCESPSPKPLTGEGTNIDDTTGDVAGTHEGDMGVPETERLNVKDGVQYGKWEAIHFDYDSATIQEKDRGNLEAIAKWMKENSGKKIMIAGHCDERGTLEYNRALGQRRASAARDYLVGLGVPAADLGTVSYGEEQPVEAGHSEEVWAKNRRDEFGVIQ